MEQIYNPERLTKELKAAGLPVAGVASTGRVDYTRELTKAETEAAGALIAAHDTRPTEAEIEAQALAAAGITLKDMVMALWAQATTGDRTAMDALAEKIDLALNKI